MTDISEQLWQIAESGTGTDATVTIQATLPYSLIRDALQRRSIETGDQALSIRDLLMSLLSAYAYPPEPLCKGRRVVPDK